VDENIEYFKIFRNVPFFKDVEISKLINYLTKKCVEAALAQGKMLLTPTELSRVCLTSSIYKHHPTLVGSWKTELMMSRILLCVA
jgi:hypothetical protein